MRQTNMQRLSDFKPLSRVVLPELGDLRCRGLVVFVGPNSSGKSQLLQDIYRRLAGELRSLVVAETIEIEKPPYAALVDCLEREGYVETVEDDGGRKHIRPRTLYIGSGQPVPQISSSQADTWYSSYPADAVQNGKRPNDFLNYFGRMLVTGLFLERRLTSLQAAGVIDFLTQPPQHDLHALYMDDNAQESLWAEMLTSFGRAVWPDTSRGNQMSLKVSDEGMRPSIGDRLSHQKMAGYRSVETEGDGLKSYLATCISLLLGRRPVCLIDEPELCLHPPQAYNLGRFIGRYGASPDTATFVATHSSHLLRGILQTVQDVQIVRLTRPRQSFSAHLVAATELTEALKRPTLRAEAVLDGIFAQVVVVVEADGDRLVYQTTWESLHRDVRIDIHFSTVGGTGGIADTCNLYRSLRIPVAVIADLDMLVDDDRMKRVLTALIDDSMIREGILNECSAIANAIRDLPPTISAAEVVERMRQIASEPIAWERRDDIAIKKRLSELASQIDRMRRLKSGGIAAYSGELSTKLINAVNTLAVHGVFLVPVGELEGWLAGYDVSVSKSKKRAWANAASQRIQEIGHQDRDVWEFVGGVGDYLISRFSGAE